MKKFFKAFIVFVMAFVVGFTSTACFGGNNNDFLNEISGIKACYKPSFYDFENIYTDYSTNLLQEIVAEYGDYNQTSPLFTDSIRYQLNDNGDDTYSKIASSSWKWQPYDYSSFEVVEDGNTKEQITSFFSLNSSEINIYYETYFINIYKTPLSIVTSQIVLGYEPTVFPAVNELVTNNDIKQEYKDILSSLQDEINNKNTYFGMTSKDKEDLVNYILNNVIGTSIVESYSTLTNFHISKKYEEKLYEIVEKMPSSWTEESYKSSYFNPFVASYIKDYSATTFFLESEGDAFKNIPEREYQSLLIMPSRNFELMEIWLGFEASVDMDIRVGIRSYNAETDTLYEKIYKTVSVKKGAFNWSDDVVMLPCQNDKGNQIYVPLTEFDNSFDNGLLNTTSVQDGYKKISPIKENEHNYSLQDFYKLRESDNGYGGTAVLNEETFKNANLGNFYEIFFDVVKTPQENSSKAFKVGFVTIWPAN